MHVANDDVHEHPSVHESSLEQYGGDHEILVYEAQVLPFDDYTLRRGTIFDLSKGILSDGALLYVPAKEAAPVDRDILKRLGLLEGND